MFNMNDSVGQKKMSSSSQRIQQLPGAQSLTHRVGITVQKLINLDKQVSRELAAEGNMHARRAAGNISVRL